MAGPGAGEGDDGESLFTQGGFTVSQPLESPATTPIPELAAWASSLRQVASQPLEFCQDFPAIARRLEAWWAGEVLDRPVFLATANTRPERPITRRLELLEDTQAWFEAKLADLRQGHRVGDALPQLRVDFGAVLMSALLGGQREVGADTSWTHAFIDDEWSNAPDWTIAEDNPYWRRLLRLVDRAVEHARGRYLVCTPDLGGSGDVLLGLRGSEQLSLDVITRPQRVQAAVDAIFPSWRRSFVELYRRSVGQGVGLIHWLGLWSDQPYVIPACDFSALIGPAHFESLFLPDIARQAASVGRAVFHLDGPHATRHLDALLSVPQLGAIQFTPGAGTPSALAWLDMLREVQARRRSLVVICPPHEVLALCEALRAEGLAIIVEEPLAPADLDRLFQEFCRRYT
jgi:hypothetical protein